MVPFELGHTFERGKVVAIGMVYTNFQQAWIPVLLRVPRPREHDAAFDQPIVYVPSLNSSQANADPLIQDR